MTKHFKFVLCIRMLELYNTWLRWSQCRACNQCGGKCIRAISRVQRQAMVSEDPKGTRASPIQLILISEVRPEVLLFHQIPISGGLLLVNTWILDVFLDIWKNIDFRWCSKYVHIQPCIKLKILWLMLLSARTICSRYQ